MPHSELHKKKRVKNFVILAILFAFIALIWIITMVKMANAQDLPQPDALLNVGEFPVIGEEAIQDPFDKFEFEEKDTNLDRDLDSEELVAQDKKSASPIMGIGSGSDYRGKMNCNDPFDRTRADHQKRIDNREQGWVDAYVKNTPRREAAEAFMDKERQVHFEKTTARPAQWWDMYYYSRCKEM